MVTEVQQIFFTSFYSFFFRKDDFCIVILCQIITTGNYPHQGVHADNIYIEKTFTDMLQEKYQHDKVKTAEKGLWRKQMKQLDQCTSMSPSLRKETRLCGSTN